MAERKNWLVLVGGGAAGRWQGGAIVAADAAGILKDVKGIVGTSVGGINACLLASGMYQSKGSQIVADGWAAIQKDEDVYTPGLTATMEHPWAHPLNCAGLTRGFLNGPAACDTTPLQHMASKFMGGVTTGMVEMRAGVKVRVRALRYAKKHADTLKGDLDVIARCTSAIEGAFERQWGYGDGGAVDNAPLDVAIANGATHIFIIYCAPDTSIEGEGPEVELHQYDPQDPPSTGMRDALALIGAISVMNETLVSTAADLAVKERGLNIIHCYPPTDTGSILDFRERGLWQRGLTESASAIAEAKAAGW